MEIKVPKQPSHYDSSVIPYKVAPPVPLVVKNSTKNNCRNNMVKALFQLEIYHIK